MLRAPLNSQALPRSCLRELSGASKRLDTGHGETLYGQHHMSVSMNEKHPLDGMRAEIGRVDVSHGRLAERAIPHHDNPPGVDDLMPSRHVLLGSVDR
ncbi:hypothetical protein SAMN05660766_0603 [Curtobacterium sp. 314Chir4.1]|nr:hypothetical protein SAMN05660766_0603 [Curtobacterium sp. 314Chir4.1]